MTCFSISGVFCLYGHPFCVLPEYAVASWMSSPALSGKGSGRGRLGTIGEGGSKVLSGDIICPAEPLQWHACISIMRVG